MKLILRLLLVLWIAMPFSATAETMANIQERGEIVVGISIFAPWTYYDRSGEFAGHEVDLGNRIAADLGVNVRFALYNFEEIFDALGNEEIDMIAGGVAMTPERARRFNFSIPYLSTGVNVATIATADNLTTTADLNNPEVTIAIVEDTLAANVAESHLGAANLMRFSTASGAEAAVLTGRAQAYVASVPETRIFALRYNGQITLPLNEPLVTGVAGFVVRAEEERLLHFLNTWVHIRKADGFLAERRQHYFDTLDWAVDMVQQ